MVGFLKLRDGQGRLSRFSRFCLAAVAALALVGGSAIPAMADPPVINTMGVDLAAHIPVFATALGLVIAAVLLVYFGMAVINRGITWFSRTSSRR